MCTKRSHDFSSNMVYQISRLYICECVVSCGFYQRIKRTSDISTSLSVQLTQHKHRWYNSISHNKVSNGFNTWHGRHFVYVMWGAYTIEAETMIRYGFMTERSVFFLFFFCVIVASMLGVLCCYSQMFVFLH